MYTNEKKWEEEFTEVYVILAKIQDLKDWRNSYNHLHHVADKVLVK